MPQVTYVQSDGTSQTIEVPLDENVMRGALYNGVEGIIGECGGGLSCATCHCYVDAEWTGRVGAPQLQEERDLLEGVAAERRPSSRLSCQIAMTAELDGLVVHVPDAQY